jgi:hypothetical protein
VSTGDPLKTPNDAWPALDYAEWAPTKKTLHMVAQMLGKARLAVSPPQPEWLHAEAMNEWMVPYEQVRSSQDPRQAILNFLNSVYRFAVTNCGWDADAQRYVAPLRRRGA